MKPKCVNHSCSAVCCIQFDITVWITLNCQTMICSILLPVLHIYIFLIFWPLCHHFFPPCGCLNQDIKKFLYSIWTSIPIVPIHITKHIFIPTECCLLLTVKHLTTLPFHIDIPAESDKKHALCLLCIFFFLI